MVPLMYMGTRDRDFCKAWACSLVPGLIYWPGPDPGPVVQEKPRPRKNQGRSKMPGPGLWVQQNPGLGPGPARSLPEVGRNSQRCRKSELSEIGNGSKVGTRNSDLPLLTVSVRVLSV